MPNNALFFDYIHLLQRNGHLKAAIEEINLFLKEVGRIYSSSTGFVGIVSDSENHLTNLSARYSMWFRQKDVIDSRDSGTEIRQISHSLTEFIGEIKKLPEIGYQDFGKVEKTEQVVMPSAPVIPRWVIRVFLAVFFSITGSIVWRFIPTGTVDKTQCWVQTKPFFAELHREPKFMPTPFASLPPSKRYQVLEVVKTPEMRKLRFRVKDERSGNEGWLYEEQMSYISPQCAVAPDMYEVRFTNVKINYRGLRLPENLKGYQVCFNAKSVQNKNVDKYLGKLGTLYDNGEPFGPSIQLGNLKLTELNEDNTVTVAIGLDNGNQVCNENATIYIDHQFRLIDAIHINNHPITVYSGNFIVTFEFRVQRM